MLSYINTLITEKFEDEMAIIIRTGNIKKNEFSHRHNT